METYLFLFIIMFFAFSIFGYIMCGNVTNPLTLFCGLWGLILLLYSMHLLKINYASDLSLGIIVIGVISFFIGGLFPLLTVKPGRAKRISRFNFDEKINYSTINIVNFVCIVFLISFGAENVRLLMNGGNFAQIRANYMSDETVSSLSSYIFNLFIWPWTFLIIPMIAIVFILKKEKTKQDKIFIWSSLGVIALFVLISAGRISLLYLILFAVLVLFFAGRRIRLSFKQWVIAIISITVIYWGISYISESRGSRPLIENLYLYLCGCIPFLSNRLSVFQAESNIYTYGLSSFHGILMIPVVLISKMFGRYPELWSIAMVNSYTEDRIWIGQGVRFNAFVTPFYYFYIDMGVVGVIFFSFIYGLIAMKCYFRLMKRQDLFSLLLYLLFALGLIMSMVRFQFETARYALAFLYLYLFFKKDKKIKFVIRSR